MTEAAESDAVVIDASCDAGDNLWRGETFP